MSVDVVVIGAGFAGLSAAEALINDGCSVVVLEAQGRVGGRSESMLNGLGERIDSGGQFVCDEMPLVLELLRRHGRRLIAADAAGCGTGPLPGDGPLFAAAADIYYSDLQAIDAADIAPESTVADWIAGRSADPQMRAALRSIAECANCMSADDQPLWTLVDMHHTGPRNVTEMQYFVDGTIHALAQAIAEPLRVRLSCPVRGIRQTTDGHVVETDGGNIVARQVILAVPPTALETIAFEPALPDDLIRAARAYRRTDTFKFLIRYPQAFWRDRGQSGLCQWTAPAGLWFGEASHDPSRPMLVGFLGGPSAATLRAQDTDARRATILGALAQALGPEALAPLDYIARDWGADAFGTGGYNAVPVGPDAPGAARRLRAGHGGIGFAATDFAPAFAGFIEGAISMGRAAAARALARIAEGQVSLPPLERP